MDALERRAFELRAVDDGAALEGIAMPYGSQGRVGRFTEEFRAGSLDYSDVLVNLFHDPSRVVARTDGGGLTLTETDGALRARIELPDTTEGRDARELVRRNILRGLSIEFKATRDEWRGTHRIVSAARLSGIGIVARPAYAGATIAEGRELRSEDHLAALNGRGVRRMRWRSL